MSVEIERGPVVDLARLERRYSVEEPVLQTPRIVRVLPVKQLQHPLGGLVEVGLRDVLAHLPRNVGYELLAFVRVGRTHLKVPFGYLFRCVLGRRFNLRLDVHLPSLPAHLHLNTCKSHLELILQVGVLEVLFRAYGTKATVNLLKPAIVSERHIQVHLNRLWFFHSLLDITHLAPHATLSLEHLDLVDLLLLIRVVRRAVVNSRWIHLIAYLVSAQVLVPRGTVYRLV